MCQKRLALVLIQKTQLRSSLQETHRTELFKGYPAVSVLVCVYDGLVHDLLQLCVLQVVPHHHLQHLKELTVGDVAVLVHVVDPEGDCAGRGAEESFIWSNRSHKTL